MKRCGNNLLHKCHSHKSSKDYDRSDTSWKDEIENEEMTDKQYKVTMTQEQYNDWLEHLTFPPNIQDVKKPNKKEYNPPGESNSHPTIKPVALMEWLVKLMSNEGDTVLDCFNGSGTTGVACKKQGRNYVGIEMNKDYIALTKKRLKAV